MERDKTHTSKLRIFLAVIVVIMSKYTQVNADKEIQIGVKRE